VDGGDFWFSDILGILEGVTEDSLAGISCDELDALDDAFNDYVLDTGVFALGIFSNEDCVDVIVGGFVTGDRAARTDVCEEVECSAEGKIEGDMAFADGGLRRLYQLESAVRTSFAYG
jgi:hypothetical protein